MPEIKTTEIPLFTDAPDISCSVQQMNKSVIVTLTIDNHQAKFWCFSKHLESLDTGALADKFMLALRDASRIDGTSRAA